MERRLIWIWLIVLLTTFWVAAVTMVIYAMVE